LEQHLGLQLKQLKTKPSKPELIIQQLLTLKLEQRLGLHLQQMKTKPSKPDLIIQQLLADVKL
jgi:hypothetical protein